MENPCNAGSNRSSVKIHRLLNRKSHQPNRGFHLAKLDSSAQLLSLPLPSTKQPDFFGAREISEVSWKGLLHAVEKQNNLAKNVKKK